MRLRALEEGDVPAGVVLATVTATAQTLTANVVIGVTGTRLALQGLGGL